MARMSWHVPRPGSTSLSLPPQPRVFDQLQDAAIALDQYQHRLPSLLQELAPPARPSDCLPSGGVMLTRQVIGRGPCQ
jgi:hypothetical protein